MRRELSFVGIGREWIVHAMFLFRAWKIDPLYRLFFYFSEETASSLLAFCWTLEILFSHWSCLCVKFLHIDHFEIPAPIANSNTAWISIQVRTCKLFLYFRRDHRVFANILPNKEEHVIMVRLSDLQKSLYQRLIELTKEAYNDSLNPIKTFHLCCKVRVVYRRRAYVLPIWRNWNSIEWNGRLSATVMDEE